MNDADELTFELRPIEERLKAGAPLDMRWETIRGKRNRIAVGTPLCAPEPRPDKHDFVDPHVLRVYDRAHFDFYRLALSLTLKPDEGCRFVEAQLTLAFDDHLNDAPLFIALLPSEKTSTKTVTTKDEDSKGVSFGKRPAASADLKHSRSRQEEVHRLEVEVASFGARTPEAGWRFRLTDSRELPIDTTDLEAIAVLEKGTSAAVTLRVAAQVEITHALDRILTSLLGTPLTGGEAKIVVGPRA